MKSNTLVKRTILLLAISLSTLGANEASIYKDVPSSLIQPNDGTWKATINSNDVKGCPSMMQSMLSKQSLPTKSKAMIFSKPFDPSTLFGEAKDLKWESVGTNKWKAVMVQAQGALNMSITWRLGINSEKKMAVHSFISMEFPTEMAAMLGGSGKCTVDTLGQFNFIK